jgi:hypothetical protein
MAQRRASKDPNALLYARRTAVLRAHESAQDLESSAKRLLLDLAAKGAGQERVRAFRAAFAAHTDVTRRRRVVSEMLAALEQLERQGPTRG